jgi:hypothetical protein
MIRADSPQQPGSCATTQPPTEALARGSRSGRELAGCPACRRVAMVTVVLARE